MFFLLMLQMTFNPEPVCSAGSVQIVGLEGELKNNKYLPHESSFSYDVESIGENQCDVSPCSCVALQARIIEDVFLLLQCFLMIRSWPFGVTAGRGEEKVSQTCWKR